MAGIDIRGKDKWLTIIQNATKKTARAVLAEYFKQNSS